MNQQEIHAAVTQALDRLVKEQPELLDLDVTERALSHYLAIYIAELFAESDYDVDVEYNRDGFDPKRLNLPPRNALENDIRATTVFPDIIVHRRNTADNLLVLEMKKDGEPLEYDELKLRAFRTELGYQYAAHIILGRNRAEVAWVN